MSRRWKGRLREGRQLQWRKTPTEHNKYLWPCSRHQLIHSSFNPYQINNVDLLFCLDTTLCIVHSFLFKMSTLSSYLNQHSSAQSGLHQRFSHPACSIGSRAVHLGVVLSRECSTTMSPPSTICVHNNLPTRDTSISLKSKDFIWFKL